MNDRTTEPSTGKILLVDDEANILKSLQREFMDAEYEIYLAQSAAEGINILEKENIDIVVSDYRMPGMDGMEFLKIVMKRFPATYRVILSGYAEQYSVLKALSSGLVSAFIPKPWQTDVLQKKIDHLFLARRALKNEEILKVVNSIEDLPTLPGVYNEFVGAVEEERPYNELALIITKDIASTTKLLRIASSAYYHLDKDASVERALSYIGINAIKQVLLFTLLAEGANWSDTKREYLHDISVHSVLVNFSLSELYKIESKKPLPEPYTSIGITHDVGKVIMLGHLPDRFDAVISYMEDHPDLDFYQSELSLGFKGTTHAEIGAFFLELWGLPRASIEASLYHHDLENHQGDDRAILEICRAADVLSNFIIHHASEANEGLPSSLERYAEKDEIYDLMANLKEKYEHLR